jgi:hypothetical protein
LITQKQKNHADLFIDDRNIGGVVFFWVGRNFANAHQRRNLSNQVKEKSF